MSYTNRSKAINNKIDIQKKKRKNQEPWERKRDESELRRLVKPKLSNVIELAKKKIISEMDARDLARIDSMEAKGTVKVFTVSLQTDHHYEKTRHCQTNFGSIKNFIPDIKQLCRDHTLSQVRKQLV